MARTQGKLRVGTSGYQYDHWRGRLYPQDLPKKRWFERYAEVFDTVEINNTFYRLPGAETFDHWKRQAPAGFLYALKYSRYGSHLKRLKDPGDAVGLFLDRAQRLGDHLGPILVQLPPKWRVDVDRLAGFLDAAPRRHRWALEFRDASWLCDAVFELLGKHGAALCVHDLIEGHPRVVTADWVYLRFHGAHGEKYAGDYPHQFLAAEARRIRDDLEAGRDVYAYFNNDAEGFAVGNAVRLRGYTTR